MFSKISTAEIRVADDLPARSTWALYHSMRQMNDAVAPSLCRTLVSGVVGSRLLSSSSSRSSCLQQEPGPPLCSSNMVVIKTCSSCRGRTKLKSGSYWLQSHHWCSSSFIVSCTRRRRSPASSHNSSLAGPAEHGLIPTISYISVRHRKAITPDQSTASAVGARRWCCCCSLTAGCDRAGHAWWRSLEPWSHNWRPPR